MEGGSGDGRETETVVNVPRDVRVVRELLRSMGMAEGDYEPRVVHQFLALFYRYVVDVLSDAQVYAEHAGKSIIDPDDVRLAIQSRANFSSAQPPPREVLMELARHGNKRPLPKTIAPPGSMPLPPEEDTLISPSYQLIVPVKQPAQAGETEEEEEDVPSITSKSNPNTNTNSSQEQRTDAGLQQLQQQLPQRVSFPFIPAAAATAKRQR